MNGHHQKMMRLGVPIVEIGYKSGSIERNISLLRVYKRSCSSGSTAVTIDSALRNFSRLLLSAL